MKKASIIMKMKRAVAAILAAVMVFQQPLYIHAQGDGETLESIAQDSSAEESNTETATETAPEIPKEENPEGIFGVPENLNNAGQNRMLSTKLTIMAGQYEIVAEGNMPNGVKLDATQISSSKFDDLEKAIEDTSGVENYEISAAFDIELTVDGQAWQPADHDSQVVVTFENLDEELTSDEGFRVYRVLDEEDMDNSKEPIDQVTEMGVSICNDGSVEIVTDHFTKYIFGGTTVNTPNSSTTAACFMDGITFNKTIKELAKGTTISDYWSSNMATNLIHTDSLDPSLDYYEDTIYDIQWTTTAITSSTLGAKKVSVKSTGSTTAKDIYAKKSTDVEGHTIILLYSPATWVYLNPSSKCMLAGLTNLHYASFLEDPRIHTEIVTNMTGMFSGHVYAARDSSAQYGSGSYGRWSSGMQLRELDLSNWNTSKVIYMANMFSCCRYLENLDLSNWDTSNVTDMSAMFEHCGSVDTKPTLDISHFSTTSLTKVGNIFSASGYVKIKCMPISASVSLSPSNGSKYGSLTYRTDNTNSYNQSNYYHTDINNDNTADVREYKDVIQDGQPYTYIKTYTVTYKVNSHFSNAIIPSSDATKSSVASGIYEVYFQWVLADDHTVPTSITPIPLEGSFAGWGKYDVCDFIHPSNTAITENTTYYAKFQIIPTFITGKYSNGYIKKCINPSLNAVAAYSSDCENIEFIKFVPATKTSIYKNDYSQNLMAGSYDNDTYESHIYANPVEEVKSGETLTGVYVYMPIGTKLNSDASYMFYKFSDLKDVTGFENIDTSLTTTVNYLFGFCDIRTIDLSHNEFTKLTAAKNMLSGSTCSSLYSLKMWDTTTSPDLPETELPLLPANFYKDYNNDNVPDSTTPVTVCEASASAGQTNLYKRFYTVTFKDGDTDTEYSSLKEYILGDGNGKAIAPADPVATGSTFEGWFEAGSDEPFDFDEPINRNVVLTAKFEAANITTTLIPGPQFNVTVKRMVDPERFAADDCYYRSYKPYSNDASTYTDVIEDTITDFVWADEPWDGAESSVNLAVEGGNPVYARLSTRGEDVVVELYTEADTVKFNSNSSYMFNSFAALKNLTLLNEKMSDEDLTNGRDMFACGITTGGSVYHYCLNTIDTLDVSMFRMKKLLSAYDMFDGRYATVIDVRGWETDSLTGVYALFSNCSKTTSIPGVNDLDMSHATDTRSIFFGCGSLETLDISDWDFSSSNTRETLFGYCENLKNLTVPDHFVTDNVTNIERLFQSCKKLEIIDASSWDTSGVTSLRDTFNSCYSLREITGIEDWEMPSLTYLGWTFFRCYSLESLDMSGWGAPRISGAYSTGQGYFLGHCYSLKTLAMFDTGNTEEDVGIGTPFSSFGSYYQTFALDEDGDLEPDNPDEEPLVAAVNDDAPGTTHRYVRVVKVEAVTDGGCSSEDSEFYAPLGAEVWVSALPNPGCRISKNRVTKYEYNGSYMHSRTTSGTSSEVVVVPENCGAKIEFTSSSDVFVYVPDACRLVSGQSYTLCKTMPENHYIQPGKFYKASVNNGGTYPPIVVDKDGVPARGWAGCKIDNEYIIRTLNSAETPDFISSFIDGLQEISSDMKPFDITQERVESVVVLVPVFSAAEFYSYKRSPFYPSEVCEILNNYGDDYDNTIAEVAWAKYDPDDIPENAHNMSTFGDTPIYVCPRENADGSLTVEFQTPADTVRIKDTSDMFYDCVVGSVDGFLNPPSDAEVMLDTSTCTAMYCMFEDSKILDPTGIDLSNWDTSNVESMYSVFESCTTPLINLGGLFSTESCKDFDSMFDTLNYIGSPIALDLSNFTFDLAEDMRWMFSEANVSEITGLSGKVLPETANVHMIFSYTPIGITDFIKNFDMSKAYGDCLFDECSNLESIVYSELMLPRLCEDDPEGTVLPPGSLGEGLDNLKILDVSDAKFYKENWNDIWPIAEDTPSLEVINLNNITLVPGEGGEVTEEDYNAVARAPQYLNADDTYYTRGQYANLKEIHLPEQATVIQLSYIGDVAGVAFPALEKVYGGQNVEEIVPIYPYEQPHRIDFPDHADFRSPAWLNFNWKKYNLTTGYCEISVPAALNLYGTTNSPDYTGDGEFEAKFYSYVAPLEPSVTATISTLEDPYGDTLAATINGVSGEPVDLFTETDWNFDEDVVLGEEEPRTVETTTVLLNAPQTSRPGVYAGEVSIDFSASGIAPNNTRTHTTREIIGAAVQMVLNNEFSISELAQRGYSSPAIRELYTSGYPTYGELARSLPTDSDVAEALMLKDLDIGVGHTVFFAANAGLVEEALPPLDFHDFVAAALPYAERNATLAELRSDPDIADLEFVDEANFDNTMDIFSRYIDSVQDLDRMGITVAKVLSDEDHKLSYEDLDACHARNGEVITFSDITEVYEYLCLKQIENLPKMRDALVILDGLLKDFYSTHDHYEDYPNAREALTQAGVTGQPLEEILNGMNRYSTPGSLAEVLAQEILEYRSDGEDCSDPSRFLMMLINDGIVGDPQEGIISGSDVYDSDAVIKGISDNLEWMNEHYGMDAEELGIVYGENDRAIAHMHSCLQGYLSRYYDAYLPSYLCGPYDDPQKHVFRDDSMMPAALEWMLSDEDHEFVYEDNTFYSLNNGTVVFNDDDVARLNGWLNTVPHAIYK